VKKLDIETYQKYKKLARGSWGKDFLLIKGMYTGMLNILNEQEEFTPPMEVILKILLSIGKARKEGRSIIMYPFNYGPELFHTMNIQPLMQEIFSVGLAPLHMNEPYLDHANEIGYGDNPTICNASRPLISAYMQGAAPIPDLLFFLSTPCNSLSMNYQVFESLTGVPTYNIDIPYWACEQESEFYDEKTMEYITDQLKSLISWLEKETKQELNIEKFQQSMVWINQAREYIMEFNELLKAVPCPAASMTGFWNWFFMATIGGTSDAVEVTKYVRDTTAENVKQGIGGIEDEKIRIAWPYTHVFFDRDLLTWLEETYNAVAIMDILGYYQVKPQDTSTLDKCYESLAMGTLDYSMIGSCRGPAEYYIDYVINYVKDYKIDCIIYPMQYACKHAYAMARITSEVVREETNIPSLIFGCDPYDSREVPAEAIRGKISDFLTQVVL
jgi:benzoyl-CoA reductase/2-hydroxyglutaryl-CoA dehydratase subunit BcrC/BadD/HgdB